MLKFISFFRYLFNYEENWQKVNQNLLCNDYQK
jgi:hypothetical protein